MATLHPLLNIKHSGFASLRQRHRGAIGLQWCDKCPGCIVESRLELFAQVIPNAAVSNSMRRYSRLFRLAQAFGKGKRKRLAYLFLLN